jgi:ProP effector
MTTNQSDIAEIIAQLANLYPVAFSTDPSRVQPLAIGVKEALLRECNLSPQDIDNALRCYTRSVGYLKTIIEGAARIDLNGQAAGVVTTGQAEYAQRLLSKGAAKLEAKSEAANAKANPKRALVRPLLRPLAANETVTDRVAITGTIVALRPSPPPTGPRRLGLADLKRAAAARRTANAF